MKLWDKGIDTNQLIEDFTVGKDKNLDLLLAEFDVIGTMAHITMLEDTGLLAKHELRILLSELKRIYNDIKAGHFSINKGVEDVHSQVELMLTQKTGDLGKKVHSGRSRNDQILLDIRLFVRNEIANLVHTTKELFDLLIAQSEKYSDVLLPGYTHLQIAMPSSFGLWFGAYAESLTDDMLLLHSAYQIANQNPLGSAAGYGSSFPLNRLLTTDLLGFETMSYNVVYAQMGRGKTERSVAFALSSVAATLSKMAMDACLYMSQNFGFLSFPDELTTGSSIMPHKKNPDVFELIRAKCNKIQSLPNEIILITNNLPSGYHRDLQIIKENFLPAFAEMEQCIKICRLMFENVKVNREIVENPLYKYMFSVEEVNKQVLNGVPFRDAYKRIAEDIASGDFNPETGINHTHEGSIGNLCHQEIEQKMAKAIEAFQFGKAEKAISQLLNKIPETNTQKD